MGALSWVFVSLLTVRPALPRVSAMSPSLQSTKLKARLKPCKVATSRADPSVLTTANLVPRMILQVDVEDSAVAVVAVVAVAEDLVIAVDEAAVAVVAEDLVIAVDKAAVVVAASAVVVEALPTVVVSETSLAPRSPSKLMTPDQWCCVDC